MDAIAVIPAYNEIENVGVLVPRLLAVSPGLSVLVVNDGSPDGTGAAVASIAASDGRVRLLERGSRKGIGSAYREGLLHALATTRHGALFVMDCDFSHDPDHIPGLLGLLETADLAIGSRYAPGGRIVGWGPHRHLLSWTANRLARASLGLPVLDCTSGFMAFRREALERLDLSKARADSYGAPVELKWLAHQAGLRLAETPITFRDRERGKSKLGPRRVFEAAATLFRLSAGRRTSPRARTPPPSPPGLPREP